MTKEPKYGHVTITDVDDRSTFQMVEDMLLGLHAECLKPECYQDQKETVVRDPKGTMADRAVELVGIGKMVFQSLLKHKPTMEGGSSGGTWMPPEPERMAMAGWLWSAALAQKLLGQQALDIGLKPLRWDSFPEGLFTNAVRAGLNQQPFPSLHAFSPLHEWSTKWLKGPSLNEELDKLADEQGISREEAVEVNEIPQRPEDDLGIAPPRDVRLDSGT